MASSATAAVRGTVSAVRNGPAGITAELGSLHSWSAGSGLSGAPSRAATSRYMETDLGLQRIRKCVSCQRACRKPLACQPLWAAACRALQRGQA